MINISILDFHKNIIECNFIFYKSKHGKDFYIANFLPETLNKLDTNWTDTNKVSMYRYNYTNAVTILKEINIRLNKIGYTQQFTIPNSYQTKEMLLNGFPEDFWCYKNFNDKSSVETKFNNWQNIIESKNIQKYLRLIYDPGTNNEYY